MFGAGAWNWRLTRSKRASCGLVRRCRPGHLAAHDAFQPQLAINRATGSRPTLKPSRLSCSQTSFAIDASFGVDPDDLLRQRHPLRPRRAKVGSALQDVLMPGGGGDPQNLHIGSTVVSTWASMKEVIPKRAVEPRLGEIGACLAQDLVGLPQFRTSRSSALCARPSRSAPPARLPASTRLLDPLVQRLRRAADLGCDRGDRQRDGHCSARDQKQRIARSRNFRRKLVARIAHDGSPSQELEPRQT